MRLVVPAPAARVLGGMDAFAYGFDNPYASYKETAPENWLTDQQLGARKLRSYGMITSKKEAGI